MNMKIELINDDWREPVEITVSSEGIKSTFLISERELMVKLVNAFIEREHKKNHRGRDFLRQARRKILHHIMQGFGFDCDWIDDAKYVTKHNGSE